MTTGEVDPRLQCPGGLDKHSRTVQGEEWGQSELSGCCESILDPDHYSVVVFNLGGFVK